MTVEQETESQDRDFEQNVSQMFWSQINWSTAVKDI